jgi:hypothetical protein
MKCCSPADYRGVTCGTSESPNARPVKWLFIFAIVILVFWGTCWWASIYFIDTWVHRSAFGEMFGSVNALFSGGALAGVLYAIFLQRRELQIQNDYSTKSSVLTKNQKDIVDNPNSRHLDDHIFNIIFQNINKKEYIVTGRLKNGRTEVQSFYPFK